MRIPTPIWTLIIKTLTGVCKINYYLTTNKKQNKVVPCTLVLGNGVRKDICDPLLVLYMIYPPFTTCQPAKAWHRLYSSKGLITFDADNFFL